MNWFRKILFVINAVLVLISLIITPFREELLLEERITDEDSLLVLKVICFFVVFSSIFYFLNKKSKNIVLDLLMIILGLYALIKVLILFTI